MSFDWKNWLLYMLPCCIVWTGIMSTRSYGIIIQVFVMFILSAIVGQAFGLYYLNKNCTNKNKVTDWKSVAKFSAIFCSIAFGYAIIIIVAGYLPQIGPLRIASMVIRSPIGFMLTAPIFALSLSQISSKEELCKS